MRHSSPKSTASTIESSARKLFLEKGFAKTSYADIAKACGVEKTNVQKHFPHKDLFIDHFFEDLLDYSDEFFAKRDMLPDDYYQALYLVGQIHFAFLLSTPELRRLTLDIVSDRKLTEAMISQDVTWATKYLEGFSLEEQQTFADNVAVVMGGMYELLYRKLSTRVLPAVGDEPLRLHTGHPGLRRRRTLPTGPPVPGRLRRRHHVPDGANVLIESLSE